MRQLGIITGLASEAGCLGGIADPVRSRVRCAGADGRRAAALARDLVREGCSALLSFGLAGGGDPRLASGEVVLADRVVAEGLAFGSDESWLARARSALAAVMPVTVGTLMGVEGAVLSGEEKRRLCAAAGAVAVDMESHAVAAVAKELGLPFLAVRVIADTASQSVPGWLPGVIDERGAVKVPIFVRGLVTHLADLADVVRLAGANRRAMASLSRVAALLGPGFGFL